MAINYQIPPWIRAPDIAQEYARGVTLGQQAAQESQRLQMQQEENQRAHLMEQQRLQVDKAYKDQQLAMQKQELDQATQLNALKVRETAGYLDARAKYNQCIQSGGKAEDCLLKYGPQMDSGTLSGYASLIKMNQPAFVPIEQTTTQGTRTIQTSPGHYQVIRPPKPEAATVGEKALQKLETTDLSKAIQTEEQALAKMPEDKPSSHLFGLIQSKGNLEERQAKLKEINALKARLKSYGSTTDVAKRAHAAIAAGADEAKVKARYKQLTGEDLDSTNTTDETTDEEE